MEKVSKLKEVLDLKATLKATAEEGRRHSKSSHHNTILESRNPKIQLVIKDIHNVSMRKCAYHSISNQVPVQKAGKVIDFIFRELT